MVVHKFLPNSTEKITERMLKAVGLESVEDLYSDVPAHLKMTRPLDVPDSMSEIELERHMETELGKNKSAPEFLNFLGGGIWLHHVPSVVSEIISRGEFYTSYTPYQPEISQGMLQALFEYQSQICELTRMEVANSSIYDWGTAVGEAGRMAARVTRRKRILAARSSSPERIDVLRTYCYPSSIEVESVNYDAKTGYIDLKDLSNKLNENVAAVYFENPNFFGVIEEDAEELSKLCHSKGALLITGVNPSTLGVLKPPGEYGADIVVGDGQPLGIFPNFGGPLIGIFATRKDPLLLRQMPGRLIGLTVSKSGTKRGYAMVLQTREQHIRREQATSNICTNEALLGLAASAYMACMGPAGMREMGERCAMNARYAQRKLSELDMDAPYFSGTFFSDLSVESPINGRELSKQLLKYGILGGLPLGRFFPELANVSVFSFSELHSPADIERLCMAISEADK